VEIYESEDAMDLTQFTSSAVHGVPLLFVVLGLVEWLKMFKNKDGTPAIGGNWLLFCSLFWGLLVGGLFMLAQNAPPVGVYDRYVYWFALVFYGLAMGLIASGLYDVLKNMLAKFVALPPG